VEELFETLRDKALSHLHSKFQDPWMKSLPEKYFEFAGNYHKLPLHNLGASIRNAYQFAPKVSGTESWIETKLAPPCLETSTPTFFNAEDYSKHLIGLVRQNCSTEIPNILFLTFASIFFL
jgi:hypothetical protein